MLDLSRWTAWWVGTILFVATFGLLTPYAWACATAPTWCLPLLPPRSSRVIDSRLPPALPTPAVTLARALTDSFAGIHMVDVPALFIVQIAGAIVGDRLGAWLTTEQEQPA